MERKFIREIYFYRNFYLDFFNDLRPEVQKKFNWTLQLIATVERVPEKFLKHITGSKGIYEIRVEVGNDIYRVFCFFDKGHLVILANGFQKKSRRTPIQEIATAEKIKQMYFDDQK